MKSKLFTTVLTVALTLMVGNAAIADSHKAQKAATVHTIYNYEPLLDQSALDPFTSSSILLNPDIKTKADLTAAEKRATVYVLAINSKDFTRAERRKGGTGSGTILDNRQCLVSTNQHVIDTGGVIKVTYLKGFTHDGERIERTVNADIIGTPSHQNKHDVAILKMHSCEDAYWSPIGDSDALRSGDSITVIGNPKSTKWAVSHGVVSSIKAYTDFFEGSANSWPLIQTDAAINSGNSGGGMFNANGELVGINSLGIVASGSSGNIGINFAHPSNVLSLYLRNLHLYGHMVEPEIGVTVKPLTSNIADIIDLAQYRAPGFEDYTGIQITEFDETSTAEDAGLQVGDILLDVNGSPIYSEDNFIREISKSRVDQPITVTVLRLNANDEMVVETIEVATKDTWVAPEPHLVAEPYLDNMGWELSIDPDTYGGVTLPVIKDAIPHSPAFRTLELHAPEDKGAGNWGYPFGITKELAGMIEKAGVILPMVKSSMHTFITVNLVMAKGGEPLFLAEIPQEERISALQDYIDEAAAMKSPIAINVSYYTITTITGVPRNFMVPAIVPDIKDAEGNVVVPADNMKEVLERIKRSGTETQYKSRWIDIFPAPYLSE